MGNGLLQVASTFTATPIRDSLRTAVVKAGVLEEVGFVLYAQMSEYMLRSADGPRVAGTMILLRLEDWLREDLKSQSTDIRADTQARQRLSARSDEFVKHIATLSQRAPQVWFLACPSTGWIARRHKLVTLCRTYTNLIVARIRKLPVTVLDCPVFLSEGKFDDLSADRLGQMPYLQPAFDQLGEFLASQIARTLQPRDLMPEPAKYTRSAELAAYLAGLRVQVKLAPVNVGDRTQVDRLLRTAAGFSLTGEKPNVPDGYVEQLLESRNCFVIWVSDRLSDYGPCGFVCFQESHGTLLIDSMALSCIVLGKQVEYAVLSALALYAADDSLARIVFEYTPSSRNEPMRTFLQSVADRESDNRYVVAVSTLETKIKTVAANPGAWTLRLEKRLDQSGILS